MTISSTELNNRKAIIVLNGDYPTSRSNEERQLAEAFSQYNLEIVQVIYCIEKCEDMTYKTMITDISSQEQKPIVIVDLETYLFPQNIISSVALGVLEHMNLAEIYTYSTSYDLAGKHKKQQLYLEKKEPDLIIESTWQLRLIQQSLDNDKNNNEET